MTNVGYSGKPLFQKIGIKSGHQVLLVNAPQDAESLLAPLPVGVTLRRGKKPEAADIILLFVTEQKVLRKLMPAAAAILPADAMLWMAWPKKSSKMPTDITEDTLRDVGLPTGLVDVKVCAVSDTWSGLKFLHRKGAR